MNTKTLLTVVEEETDNRQSEVIRRVFRSLMTESIWRNNPDADFEDVTEEANRLGKDTTQLCEKCGVGAVVIYEREIVAAVCDSCYKKFTGNGIYELSKPPACC